MRKSSSRCLQCETPLEPKSYKRSYCSIQCANIHTGLQKSGVSLEDRNRECPECNTIFHCGENLRKRFCSHSCAAKSSNRTRIRVDANPLAPCKRCGKTVKWRGSIYCSKDCKQADILQGWLEGKRGSEWGNLPSLVRKYLFETRGRKCEICGWDEIHPVSGVVPVEIDHIDGDSRNHRIENLKILCPNHHALTPTYRNLNPRGRKRKKVSKPGSMELP